MRVEHNQSKWRLARTRQRPHGGEGDAMIPPNAQRNCILCQDRRKPRFETVVTYDVVAWRDIDVAGVRNPQVRGQIEVPVRL